MSSKTPTGNLNFGIPYRKTPPICDLFSNIVTLYPFLANIKANDIPAKNLLVHLLFLLYSFLNTDLHVGKPLHRLLIMGYY